MSERAKFALLFILVLVLVVVVWTLAASWIAVGG